MGKGPIDHTWVTRFFLFSCFLHLYQIHIIAATCSPSRRATCRGELRWLPESFRDSEVAQTDTQEKERRSQCSAKLSIVGTNHSKRLREK